MFIHITMARKFLLIIRYLTQNFLFLKNFNSEFSLIEVRFTDQNSKRLEIEDKIKMSYKDKDIGRFSNLH